MVQEMKARDAEAEGVEQKLRQVKEDLSKLEEAETVDGMQARLKNHVRENLEITKECIGFE